MDIYIVDVGDFLVHSWYIIIEIVIIILVIIAKTASFTLLDILMCETRAEWYKSEYDKNVKFYCIIVKNSLHYSS